MKHIVILSALVFVFLPTFAFAETLTKAPSDSLQKMIAELEVQIATLQGVKKSQSGATATPSTTKEAWKFNYSKANLKLGLDKEVSYDKEDIVNLFWVMNNRLYEDGKWTKNKDTDDHRMWNIFSAIAGDTFIDKYVTRYATFRDADTSILGFVELLTKKEPAWGFAVNANASNFESAKWVRDLVAVSIHEYAHVLTLNSSQITYNKKNKVVCKGHYLTLRGCAQKKSYINSFVLKFWDEEDLKHKEKPAKYFKSHPDDFVTWYAPKNPEEDIAESFTQFILYERPAGIKEKDLKVLFFYEYPELVDMRTRIRKEIEKYFLK